MATSKLALFSVLFGVVLNSIPVHSSQSPDLARRGSPDPSLSTSITVGGHTFVNKGLVAFGLIPTEAKDSYGETLGGFGSSIAIQRGTFKARNDGTFTGKFVVLPDRGYNVESPVDWQNRFHYLSFTLNPYYNTTSLSFTDAQQTLKLQYLSTTLLTFKDKPTSGADPTFSQKYSGSSIQYPLVAANYTHLTADTEGLVHSPDGNFWISDEYAPYVYQVSPKGKILNTIAPPDAAIPRIGGKVNFTSLTNPDTGRAPNQGMEGLTASPSGDRVYGLLQSALMQEGGGNKTTNRYARFFKWNVEKLSKIRLDEEYVVPLPQSSKPETYAQSEIHWMNKDQFLVLARDGKGNGDSNAKAAYKSIDIFDVSAATNIANTQYDDATGSVAPGGQLLPSITPATYTPFVQIVNSTQLARFGLHNDKPVDRTLIAAKWESIALAPVNDHKYPDDYFLFTFADNDFMTQNGISMGKPYNATVDVDNQALVYRVTLPTVKRGSIERALGI
ncbi:hypothetical protein FS842_009723 [Serendipita sp. 407]|nr:hypothetical protein FS842_009723 [Serendipita sp. 407]